MAALTERALDRTSADAFFTLHTFSFCELSDSHCLSSYACSLLPAVFQHSLLITDCNPLDYIYLGTPLSHPSGLEFIAFPDCVSSQFSLNCKSSSHSIISTNIVLPISPSLLIYITLYIYTDTMLHKCIQRIKFIFFILSKIDF